MGTLVQPALDDGEVDEGHQSEQRKHPRGGGLVARREQPRRDGAEDQAEHGEHPA